MAEWKLDLETYGIQVEEVEEKHGPIFLAVREIVTSAEFQAGMTVLVFMYLIAASTGMLLGKLRMQG
ncbi:hypothetical protein DSO57_1004296 [Entomophthora muscae]|uniref:Uncharacterized protein n=1 Tax=Entomophthora muscae TaxID=34485 RepID=A0ACC2TWD6_9FUNG|nr:hypothetical protein DSO57_1004296 [Entomophthora muscae]